MPRTREGNAWALFRALELLLEMIEKVMIRGSSAGNSANVLRQHSRPEWRLAATQRSGVIGFAVSAVRSQELMAEVARVLEKRKPECGGKPMLVEVNSAVETIAEERFVSNENGFSRRGGILRDVAVRRIRGLTRSHSWMRWVGTMASCLTSKASRPVPSAC